MDSIRGTVPVGAGVALGASVLAGVSVGEAVGIILTTALTTAVIGVGGRLITVAASEAHMHTTVGVGADGAVITPALLSSTIVREVFDLLPVPVWMSELDAPAEQQEHPHVLPHELR